MKTHDKLFTNRMRVSFSIVAISIVLAACSSLINPHINAPLDARPYLSKEACLRANKKKPEKCESDFAGGVARAIEYANSWRDAYYRAVGEQSSMKNSMAALAFPASAAALFLGLREGGSDKNLITALGVGVAGMIGLGSYYESRDRQRVYLEGHRVLGCLILASTPFLIPNKEFEDLIQSMEEIRTQSHEIDTKLPVFETYLEGLQDPELPDFSRDYPGLNGDFNEFLNKRNDLRDAALLETADIKRIITEAEEMRLKGLELVGRIEIAGRNLITMTDTIVGQVSNQLLNTEATLSAIGGITDNLENAARRYGNFPEPKPLASGAVEDQTSKQMVEIGTSLAGEIDNAISRTEDDIASIQEKIDKKDEEIADLKIEREKLDGTGATNDEKQNDIDAKIRAAEDELELFGEEISKLKSDLRKIEAFEWQRTIDQLEEDASEIEDVRAGFRDMSNSLVFQMKTVRDVQKLHASLASNATKLSGCNMADVIPAITVTPAATNVEISAGQSYPIVITGGKRPYSAQLVGAVPEGVDLERGGFDKQPVVATVKVASTVTGSHSFSLVINDATGEVAKVVNFKIMAANPEPEGKPDNPDTKLPE